MIKSEVLEIRRQFKEENSTISRICGCYVDSEKEKKAVFCGSFLTLPEEDMLKYFEIFKKTLSGTMGKNLLNMEFPRDEEFKNENNDFLMEIKNSELKDDELLEKLYDQIISSYDYAGNYLILLIHAAYDIPGRSTDELEMEDASDEVYRYIMCSICPVDLSKPALSYQPEENKISHRNRDWVVGMPINGFLFPAFNERSTDVNNILYYTKKPSDIHDELVTEILGCEPPLTADVQKETFTNIIEESLGEDCSYDAVKNIHESLSLMLEESKEDLRPETIDREELKNVLLDSGVKEENINILDKKIYDNEELKSGLHLGNLVNTRSFDVKMPNISIKISPESVHLLETKIVDGRKSIVIPITDEVEVNGVPVNVKDEDN